MMNFKLNYTHPWLLLLLIPAILFTLIPYFRIAKKYRRTRNRVISMVLHALAMILAINLLAGLTFSYEIPNEENELILLVDVSDSGTDRDAKDNFVQSVYNVCDEGYRVGVVKFGYDQKYVVKLSGNTSDGIEQYMTSEDPDTTASNLSAALQYTAGLFENPKASKIVILSDGIETDGAAMSVIKAIAAEGTKVDTVYFPNEETQEIQIVDVKTPDQHITLGEEFLIDMTFRSNLGNKEQKMTLNVYDNEELLGTSTVTVNKPEQTIQVALALETRGMHDLRFEIENATDTLKQNNIYHSYIHLQIFENILLIERDENESEKLQKLLSQTYNVTALSMEEDLAEMPRTIRDMADYEQVILVNIAYSDMPAGFEELLNEYVYNLGGGLFTVGGTNDVVNGEMVPHAYNRADIANSTYYKQMLPVNAIDYTPPIAVMIVIDASASMSMGKLDAAKEGAAACLDALNDRDFCGVISFQTRASEEQEILPVSQRETILETIRGIGEHDDGAHGGTIFSDAIMRAGRALSVINNVERKHIILVTDGNPGDTYDTYLPYIQDNVKDGITMSIVTVDIDSSLKEKMENTASAGGGKFYNVPYGELYTLPLTMQKDLALEATPEIAYGEEFNLTIKDRTSVVEGIAENAIPPLTGYYGTVAKKDAVVPLMGKYVPMYAQWKYGAGNVGSFMCDLNGNWSQAFMDDLVGQTIVLKIVESIFPMEDVCIDGPDYMVKTENYTTQLNVHGVLETEQIEVVVTPLTQSVAGILENGIPVVAAESNRRFTFELKHGGLYQITIRKLDEAGTVLNESVFYKTFSYSEEYNAFPTRAPLGEELMVLLAESGKGALVEDPVEIFLSFEKTLKREIDPRMVFLILVIVLFLLDIAVRKFKFKWPHELVHEYKQKKADAKASKNAS